MNAFKYFLLALLVILSAACREEVDESRTPDNVFETLWTLLDERYCFFESKNVDWNEVHDRYQTVIDTCSSQESLFRILGTMICELKDGHVNLYSSSNLIRYWKWFEDYPKNYDQDLIDEYLGRDYGISAGLIYKTLSTDIGYINYRSFSSSLSDAGLDYIFKYFKNCKGIVIDVRDNSGGDLSNVTKFASRFTEERAIGFYICHKTGPGHNEFSKPLPVWIEPSEHTRYTGKVIVLTNRLCYSATNTFVSVMKNFSQVTTLGDRTGGGGGFPITSMLPNGWMLRFSTGPTYNSMLELIEEGLDPDVPVQQEDSSERITEDTLLEEAIRILKS